MKSKKKKLRRLLFSFLLIGFCLGVPFGIFMEKVISNYIKNGFSQTQLEQINKIEENEETDEIDLPKYSINKIEEKKKQNNAFVLSEEMIAEHEIANRSSSEDRNNNMYMAARIINGNSDGYILNPCEEFSWLDVVGNPTIEKGFKKATVIVRGKTEDGIGGGICQVSTTINSAITKLGIHTKARKHSAKPGYLESKDSEATVSFESGIDFSFENTLSYPIRIKVETEGGLTRVLIYSRKMVPIGGAK